LRLAKPSFYNHPDAPLNRRPLTTLLFVLVLSSGYPFHLRGAEEARVVSIENIVQFSKAGSSSWMPARADLPLLTHDRVRTGERSRATVRLSDLTLLRLQELTTLVLEPIPELTNKNQLNLEIGSTYFFNRERPKDLKFKTPLASGAIRGTEFHLSVGGDGTTLVTLLEGAVDLFDARGEGVVLAPGEQGIVEPGKPPRKTAVLDAVNIIQWALYYPAILNLNDLNWSDADREGVKESVSAYQRGNLLKALELYPADRKPANAQESTYLAALLLSVGQTESALKHLEAYPTSAVSGALQEMISAVKGVEVNITRVPQSSTEWLARSYTHQSRRDLKSALQAARKAMETAPDFGFPAARAAELEFSHGESVAAAKALEKALELTPENAQAQALQGYVHAARYDYNEARRDFERAIQIDPALGNAWLGRGLLKAQRGDERGAREDMHTAATVEPRRSLFRSYLGKAFAESGDRQAAVRELGLAGELDPEDPTPLLYSALLKQQQNKINEAVGDLERSQELNENRSVFRSQLLLEQDLAVRGANLAGIYRDAAMPEVSLREASEAVHADYGNSAAHLFLANTFAGLRDPRLRNLRYETPWLNELLLANLLAPVGAGNLSQSVSEQEYSKLFEERGFGVRSSTEYFSYGRWVQSGSHFGTFDRTSYSLDAFYESDNGQRVNEDAEILSLYAKFKFQLTPVDSVFLQVERHDYEFGDVRQVYDPTNPRSFSSSVRVKELQEPNVYLGYHHEWRPGVHTLFLAGRLSDELEIRDTNATLRTFVYRPDGTLARVEDVGRFNWGYGSELEAYSTELQQIFQVQSHTLIGGARYQLGESETFSNLERRFTLAPPYFGDPPAVQQNETDLERTAVYLYDLWQVHPRFQVTGGVSFDHLEYPRNIDVPPISAGETESEQFSPKAGFIWNPLTNTLVRGAYTRSLGGVFYDQSVRLEPSQIAGFVQSYRSLIPESVAGLVPGAKVETFGLGIDQKFWTRTYAGISGELLRAEARRTLGVFDFSSRPAAASSTRENLDFSEKTVSLYVNQLLGDEWSIGGKYRVSQAELDDDFEAVPATLRPDLQADVQSYLHQATVFALFQHRCGFFSSADANWYQQSNQGYSPDLPGDDFWQFNVAAGYRFPGRRAEVQVALLNVADEDYKLTPLNYYLEMPRDRTLALRFKFFF
jgi:tetratricopeptide (TPR) repeat protein